MAGLTREGFTPDTYSNIKARIEGKIETINPGFDFSPESPDGQFIGTMAFELAQNWNQLDLVYNSYNPQVASGAGLRNIGLLTGLPYGAARRSFATCEVAGVSGTIIPRGTIVVSENGDEFYTAFETAIPSNLQVVAVLPGPVSVDAGTLNTIQSPISGWASVNNLGEGTLGSSAQTEQEYRNTRQRTVMRNYTSSVDTMQARLVELGLGQARVLNNTHPIDALPDGTPANTVHVTVGELGDVAVEDVAKVIFETNSVGCPTYLHPTSGQTVVVKDAQGVDQTVNFSVATAVPIEIVVDVTYLSDNVAGVGAVIVDALVDHINNLISGEDVIWSRLFSYITPYAKAQVNSLTIGRVSDGSPSPSNITLSDEEFASIVEGNITLTVDGV